jgi:SAM-dependent methyltransferase
MSASPSDASPPDAASSGASPPDASPADAASSGASPPDASPADAASSGASASDASGPDAAASGVSPVDVYSTARGPLARVASPLAARARMRRHERFFALARLRADARVLDVGCGALGLRAFEPALDITGVDVGDRRDYPGPFVCADVAEGLPFETGEFDLAYCTSVIEHVPRARRPAFAAEVRRVARGWLVQTPAFSFPIEPHSLLPFAHWLPPSLRRRYWRLSAARGFEEIELLRRAEIEALFGPALAERFGPLVKSWVCVRPPA